MIRTSKHTTKFANTNKQLALNRFLQEYRRVALLYLDYLWSNKLCWSKNKVLDIKNQLYNCPNFISTTNIPITTTLSARALKCCSTQVCGIVKAVLEKPRRRLYKLELLKQQGKDYTKLLNKINKHPITKSNISDLPVELNSICCDLLDTNTNTNTNSFNAYLQLKSIGKSFGKIRIPIKYHRQSNRWLAKGKRLNSFLISECNIAIRYEVTKPPIKQTGLIIGADQGLLDCLTLSNGNRTPHTDIHGHTLKSIITKLSRKTKGSKAFLRAQSHRTNFINWSINQLNLSDIKQINLERIVNITYKKHTTRLLKHWTNTLIRDKLLKLCEDLGVLIYLQSSVYRSQRCSRCGLVCKANRKGKLYRCRCGLSIDSDLNAALNHSMVLPDVGALYKLGLNRKGFYWKPEGLYTLTGGVLTVPLSDNK